MGFERNDSSTHISFLDGTSSASEQPIVETTAPSDNLARMMANWILLLPPAFTATERRTNDLPTSSAKVI